MYAINFKRNFNSVICIIIFLCDVSYMIKKDLREEIIFMNVIYLYAQAKDNLTKEEANEVCKLYMKGLKYKEAVSKVRKSEQASNCEKGENYYGR